MAKPYAEVRAICHRPSDTVYTRVFYRKLTVPTTYLLQFTPVTANAVSYAGLVFGLLAFVGFAWGTYGGFLAGALLWQLMVIADHVDGEVARVKGTSGGMSGGFIEYVAIHCVGHPIALFGAGIGAWRRFGDPLYLWLGAAATFAVLVSIIIYLLSFHLRALHWAKLGRPRAPPPVAAPAGGAPAPAPPGLAGRVAGLVRGALVFLSGILEFGFILVGAGLVDLVGASLGVLPAWHVPVAKDAATVVLLLYGVFFSLGTAASFVSHASGRLDADFPAFVAFAAPAEPDPRERPPQ